MFLIKYERWTLQGWEKVEVQYDNDDDFNTNLQRIVEDHGFATGLGEGVIGKIRDLHVFKMVEMTQNVNRDIVGWYIDGYLEGDKK